MFLEKNYNFYEIYVQSTDEFGGQSFSETIVINILHNELPVINIDTVADGMEYDASRLSCITVKASDSDGEVKKIDLYVRGHGFKLGWEDFRSNGITIYGLSEISELNSHLSLKKKN